MSSPVVITVDCSTTSSKAIAFDPDGRAIAEAHRAIERSSPHPGWQEQDPAAWWHATTEALRELTGRLDSRFVPRALGITHQRETFACLDADGAALRPAILWIDTRAGAQIARLGTERVHAISGKPPSTTPSLYKLAWLAEHEPEVLAATDLVVDVHAYLVRHLTGETVTSWACADPLSMLDMATFTWSDELVALAGLDAGQLPALAAPGSVLGQLTGAAAELTGLPAELPVVAGAGDGQSAGLGAGVRGPGRAYLNLGTGLTLGVHAETYAWSRAYRTLSSPIAGAYTLEALLSSGALSIAWFRDQLSGLDGTDREQQLEAMAAEVPPGARGLLFLPYLTSAETPHWDADARAAYLGLSADHGRPEMYRAILEGLAYEERLSLERLEASTGEPVERVVVLGGAAQSVLFTQLLADVLERPIDVSAEIQTTALGVGILAAAAIGLDGCTGIDDAAHRMAHVSATREPDETDRATYRAAASIHAELYPSVKALYPRLAALRDGAPPA